MEGEDSRRKWSLAPETAMGMALSVSVEQTRHPTRLEPLFRSRCHLVRRITSALFPGSPIHKLRCGY